MDVKISYFYKIRTFSVDMLPISTALYDPKWYHNNLGPKNIFTDKRGVVNGVRLEALSPKYIDSAHSCTGRDSCIYTPGKCPFIEEYYKYLKRLDFKAVQKALIDITDYFKNLLNLNKMIPVLIVYESPTNPCSERESLVTWFKEHNENLIEV